MAMIATYLQGQMEAVLKLAPGEINPNDILTELADSLMLAELKTRIEADFRIELRMELLFEEPTLGALTEWLSGQLSRDDFTSSIFREGDSQLLEDLVSEMEELPESEVPARLVAERDSLGRD